MKWKILRKILRLIRVYRMFENDKSGSEQFKFDRNLHFMNLYLASFAPYGWCKVLLVNKSLIKRNELVLTRGPSRDHRFEMFNEFYQNSEGENDKISKESDGYCIEIFICSWGVKRLRINFWLLLTLSLPLVWASRNCLVHYWMVCDVNLCVREVIVRWTCGGMSAPID